jgi:hypothetical protein
MTRFVFFGLALIGLSGCHHPYNPDENPLLTEPVTRVVPALISLEKMVQEKLSSEEDWWNDGTGVSFIYACYLNQSHFETPEARGPKHCQRLFSEVLEAAHRQSGILSTLTLDDLTDPTVKKRIGQGLYTFSIQHSD